MSLQRVAEEDLPKVLRVLEDSFATTVFQQVLVKHKRGLPFDAEHDIKHHRGIMLESVKTDFKAGAEIVQAENFGGVAIWYKPGTHRPDTGDAGKLINELKEASKAVEKRHGLVGRKAYYLFMIARDPAVKTKGIASKLIRPYEERARKEGAIITLEAISDTARSVYEHLGLKVVETVYIWKGLVDSQGRPDANGEGVPFHYMIYE